MNASAQTLSFNFPSPCAFDVRFNDFQLSSDSGLLLARQADSRLGLSQRLADCLLDPRQPSKVIHSLPQLLRQRLLQLVAGYEDVNDSSHLRYDPIFKLACDRIPGVDSTHLASQPTLSRLENRVTKTEISAMRSALLDHFIESFREPPKRIVLDIDGWDAATHGHQQLSFFHGYYRQHMYFPVLINDAETGYPLVVQLRPGNSHPGKGVAALLRWLIWRLRRAWPGVELVIRTDGGFALPELLRLYERAGVSYVTGFARNKVLERKSADLVAQAHQEYCRTEEKVRWFGEDRYAAESWPCSRRLIIKVEWTEKGRNLRFLVTNLADSAEAVYDEMYVQRGGDSEHRVKELKRGMKADRLSCHRSLGNQFRLLLGQAAYVLMLKIREAAWGTCLERAQVTRLRETLIKVAGRVRTTARRVRIDLPSHCPYAKEIAAIAQHLSGAGVGAKK